MANSRSSRWKYVRRQCWERDRKNHAVCGICGQPIDYSIPPSSTDASWEPDHIRTFKDCPELELDPNNVRASHRKCNRNRGAVGHLDNGLGRRTRIW